MDSKNSHLTSDDIEDDILLRIAKVVDEDERRPHIDNPKVIEKIEKVYDVIKNLFTGYYKIEKRIHDPFPSTAYIKIYGKKLKCKNGLTFYELRKYVDNIEAYYLTNGDVTISFTFHGVTRFVDD